jgi:uncharacterized RDD family membrane protein YckC
MKCPKCDYLGFEATDKCRNCGYEFSLLEATSDPFDLPLEEPAAEPLIPSPDAGHETRRRLDLDRIIGGPAEDLPLFAPETADVDAPMITTPSRPRAPLSVRRTTPEIPRARVKTARPAEMLFEQPPVGVLHQHGAPQSHEALASPITRIAAALIDLMLVSLLDAVVVYFTLRLLGLAAPEMLQLPAVPLAAFFLILNGGYFIAFTAVGGQSIGKMALGIKVVCQEAGSVPIGRAALRTAAYLVSALPLGAGFLPGVMGAERLAFHDRLAHTRVVRPSVN